MDKRCWKIIIGIDNYYLSEEDKNFYLNAIAQGQSYVALKNGLILSKNFQSIVSVKMLEDFLKIEAGKWQCTTGKWHWNKDECDCGREYKLIDPLASQKLI